MRYRMPDMVFVYTENAVHTECAFDDVSLQFLPMENGARLQICADATPLRYVRMRWNFRADEIRHEPLKILGDEWERGYGLMEWRGIVPTRCMPWVCMVSNGSDSAASTDGRYTECFGVKVRPNALCFWQYDECGLTLWADIRNGGSGVLLGGRTLDACEILFGEYRDMTAFRAIRAFYGTLCTDALVPDHKVYGSNNWYYAYGNSSHAEIIRDAKLVSSLCAGLENRPYMVIDDGWQPNHCDAPWNHGNERFPDMAGLAAAIRAEGARPGIWIRYLSDAKHEAENILPEYRLMRDEKYLDPSHPAVLARVAEDTRRIVETWGFELIKHDFSTFDVFGNWGFLRPTNLTDDGWHFHDRTRTSAEIMLDFYRTIRTAAGKNTVIIGCNVMGHLAAGLVELNRTGDDTSGRQWEQTRKNGVNTLAFHMMHDKNFFAADADCVGIMGAFDWKLNREWLKALSESGSPLFVSCKPDVPDDAAKEDLRRAFARNSVQADVLEPVDWMENTCPSHWLLNGQPVEYHWYPECGTESFRP